MIDLKPSDTPKPCPFCGEAPNMKSRPNDPQEAAYFAAVACYCGGYSACAHQMATANTRAEAEALAMAAWNRRTPARTITEEQPVAAVKVLLRANGLDGLPQRMLDAMNAAAPDSRT